MPIRAIVTDIEGTTTDIRFVSEVLFPFASQTLPDFIRQHQHQPDVATELAQVNAVLNQPDADVETQIQALLHWIDTDQKITPLKQLQGLVWAQGYQDGRLKGHLYPDVAPRLRLWQQQGTALYVYSSGSVAAQQLLFRHSTAGDLTGLFSGYFDTRIGGKKQSDSYQRIAAQLGLAATELLFLSDSPEEIAAARQAGWHCVQLVRGNQHSTVQPQANNFDQVHNVMDTL